MKLNKRLLVSLSALVLANGLVACSGDSNNSSKNSSSSSKTVSSKKEDPNKMTLSQYINVLKDNKSNNGAEKLFNSTTKKGNVVTIEVNNKAFKATGKDFEKEMLSNISSVLFKTSKNSNSGLQQVIFKSNGKTIAQSNNDNFSFKN